MPFIPTDFCFVCKNEYVLTSQFNASKKKSSSIYSQKRFRSKEIFTDLQMSFLWLIVSLNFIITKL